MIAPSMGASRTNEDFASHIARTIATDPDAGLDLRGGPTQHPPIRRFGKAGRIGVLDQVELDGKGNLKHIKSMASGALSCKIPSIGYASCTRPSTPRGSIR